MIETWSLCKECYGIVPATFDGSVLTKVCPTHGVQSAKVDPEDGFYNRVHSMPPKPKELVRLTTTALSITNRCNLRCPGCYALPDWSDDDSRESILTLAKKTKGQGIVLMGAEPTMRDDLPEIVKELKEETKKPILILTNGIRLEDEKYLGRLEESGLSRIVMSLHLPSYVGKKAFNSKIKAIENIKKTSIPFDHVNFSLKTISEVEGAIKYIVSLDFALFASGYVRLRAPAVIGGVRNKPCTMSEFLNAVLASCEKLGYSVLFAPFSNHLYAVLLVIEGKPIMLVRWPTVEEIDLQELQYGPPTALFVPSIGETQIIHQGMITERVRSGGALPPPPPLDCPPHILGV